MQSLIASIRTPTSQVWFLASLADISSKVCQGLASPKGYARFLRITIVGRHRARCLTVRLPMPPVRPVRETFASYGSRERDIMGKVHFASSTVHSPWTALRVRWVPVYCFPTRSLRPFAMCVAFLRSDYYALFDCPMWPRSFVGLSLTYFPPSFTSTLGAPVFNK